MASSPTIVRSRLFRPLWHDERFYVLDTEPNVVESPLSLEYERHFQPSAEFAAAMQAIRGSDVPYDHRFLRGHVCFVIRHDGKPIGCGWASIGEWGGDGPPRTLASGTGFVFDGFTQPEYRGKRVAPARQAYVARQLRADGCLRICTTIRDDNIASQKAAMRAGYRRTEHCVRVYRMRVMGWLQSGGPPPEFLPPTS